MEADAKSAADARKIRKISLISNVCFLKYVLY